MSFDRRELLQSALAAAAASLCGAQPGTTASRSAGAARGGPIVVGSGNGLAACTRAYEGLLRNDDPLDAVVAGVNIIEDDPNDQTVGLGGLPNEDGVVELDSSVMHGPTAKGGSVASLRNIRNPSRVAQLVMQRTDHVLLVGERALRFARAHGFVEENLLTEKSRADWLRWKESLSPRDNWIAPASQPASAPGRAGIREPSYGTVTCLALTTSGDLAGCTSTSGLAWKIPGRVGDSPILGAGLYVDNETGACGSTGRGEANLLNLSSFLVVELMRAGRTPEEACLAALERIARKTEPRLRGDDGRPVFGLKLYAVRKDGMIGGASLGKPGEIAVHDADGPRRVPTPAYLGA